MTAVANLDLGSTTETVFWGDLAVVALSGANWDPAGDGFAVVDIARPERPRLLSTTRCTWSNFDISIWRDLVITSTAGPLEHAGCAAGPVTGVTSDTSWQGLRIFSIADPANPAMVAAIRTRCVSHTHTLVPDPRHRDEGNRPAPRLLVYNSAAVEPGGSDRPGGGLACDDVIEIPLGNPQAAKRIGTTETHQVLGGCHDVTVFLPLRLAAAACLDNTQLWDITDPARPEVIARIAKPTSTIHHSTAFSLDGGTLVIGDESVTQAAASQAPAGSACPGGTGVPEGALWFYDITDPRAPVLRGWFQRPDRVGASACFVHQFNVVPLRSDRDVLVSSWIGGGTSVIDFTDPSRPQQLGYYAFDPTGDRRSSAWSSYWYNGHIYSTSWDYNDGGLHSRRGWDVLRIDHPALRDAVELPHLNPQTQEALPRQAGTAPLLVPVGDRQRPAIGPAAPPPRLGSPLTVSAPMGPRRPPRADGLLGRYCVLGYGGR